MVAYIRMEKKLSFFRSQISVAAGQRGRSLLLSSLDMTLFTASHTCDVSHAWPKSERFQNGRWLSVKKIGFAQYIIYLLIQDSLT